MAIQDIHKKSIYLMLIMASVVAITVGIAIAMLYRAAFQEESNRLVEIAESEARTIEAIMRHDQSESPDAARQHALAQIREAHKNFKGFGKTGEFTLAELKNNQIVFLLSHRHHDLSNPHPVAFGSNEAEPMRLALTGQSGTVVGPDYRGETVLAAYEPVALLNMGIVAKIDLTEIRAPFELAALYAASAALLLVLAGAWAFQRITRPIHSEIRATIKNISGIVPLCAWCGNKIRDDSGEWVTLEAYLSMHTDAKVSHGMCPKCAEKFARSLDS
ncbi:MAG TPA: hypothetical protein VNI58_05660 [Mariprofundaceae bacterium]|nr:hypothetical protein [Mariprofundaceae bacterium]